VTCRQFETVAHDYFLDHLSPDEVARADRHVAECPDCAEFMRICRELSCREFAEFLDGYIDGTLEAEQRAVFDRHLAICEDCGNYLASYRRVIELSVLALGQGGKLPSLPVPEELVRAILAARRERPGPG